MLFFVDRMPRPAFDCKKAIFTVTFRFNQNLQRFVVSLRGKKAKESTSEELNGDAAVPLTAKGEGAIR